MKLFLIKLMLVGGLLGGSYAFYTFGTHDVVFEVPVPVAFKDIASADEKVEEDVVVSPEEEPSSPPASSSVEASTPSVEGDPIETPTPSQSQDDLTVDLPPEVNLAVPFTSQAPFGNWDDVHEETCEEAAVLMVHAYYEGQARDVIDPSTADEVLLDMTESEVMMFGYFEDTTVAETVRFAEAYYGYDHIEIIENPTINQLKAELVAGRPVIVPTSGRLLANPFFSGIGPIYHMIVLKGYTENGFIVNDPGTRRGADWVYAYETLMTSIHDWVVPEGIEDRPQDIPDSARRVFVIYP